MRRFALAVVMLAVLVPLPAEALSLRDVIELTRAGLSDDVLLALIEVDRPVFSTDAATLKALKAAGVSDRVIVAMVRSGRSPAAPPPEPVLVPEPAPEPQVIVVDHRDDRPRVREVPVAVPVYIPVVVRTGSSLHPVKPKSPEPVYWGWGGKRRPDAWQEAPPDLTPRPRRR